MKPGRKPATSSLAQQRIAVLAREVAVLTGLRDAPEAARSQARGPYFAPVLHELRPLLGLLFDDASVTFHEDTPLPRSVRRNGQDEQVGVLSGGMREQLAILTRLTFARLLAKGRTAHARHPRRRAGLFRRAASPSQRPAGHRLLLPPACLCQAGRPCAAHGAVACRQLSEMLRALATSANGALITRRMERTAGSFPPSGPFSIRQSRTS